MPNSTILNDKKQSNMFFWQICYTLDSLCKQSKIHNMMGWLFFFFCIYLKVGGTSVTEILYISVVTA